VRRRGHWTITLGSASGYVELFYMKNGFIPVSYRVEIPRDRLPQNDGKTGYEVAGRVMLGDAVILYLKVTEYNPADKEVIKRLFDTDDVLYIFEKDV
jgi:hypothetical protein